MHVGFVVSGSICYQPYADMHEDLELEMGFDFAEDPEAFEALGKLYMVGVLHVVSEGIVFTASFKCVVMRMYVHGKVEAQLRVFVPTENQV